MKRILPLIGKILIILCLLSVTYYLIHALITRSDHGNSFENRRWHALALDSIGRAAEDSSNFSKAIDCYTREIDVMEKIEDTVTANAYENLGFVFEKTDQYHEALSVHRKSLAIRRSLGKTVDVGASLNNIGMILQCIGDYQSSSDTLRQALRIARELDIPEGPPSALNNISINYAYLGQYQKSIDTAKETIRLARDISRHDIEADALVTMGFDFLNLRRFDSAIIYYRRAIDLFQYPDKNLSITLSSLGLVYNAEQKFHQAELYIDSSLQISRANGDGLDEAISLSKLGLVYVSSRRYKEAFKVLNVAVPFLKGFNHPEYLGTVYERMMHALKGLNRNGEAILFGKLAVNAFQGQRIKLQKMDPEVQRDYLKSKESTYRDLVELLIGQGRLDEAQYVLKMLKEDEYFESIERGEIKTSPLNLVSSLDEDESDISKEYETIADSLFLIGCKLRELERDEHRTPLEDSLMLKLKHSQFIENAMIVNFLDSLDNNLSAKNDSAKTAKLFRDHRATLQNFLADDEALIQTILTENNLNVILVTRQSQKRFQVSIKRERLFQLIEQFREGCDNPEHDVHIVGKQLYHILLDPLLQSLREINAKTLIWSLDEKLRYVPLASLYDGRQYLIEQYKLAVLTLDYLDNLNNPTLPFSSALGLGVTGGIDQFPPLPGVKEELYGIIRTDSLNYSNAVLPGEIKLNEQFTKQVILSIAQKFPVVHIATHFQLIPGDDRESFLLLGDGEHLSLRTIRYLSSPFNGVELLTLSACNTAVGTYGANGREFENFAVLSEQQGAKSVIATLWPVTDGPSTGQLMRKFYEIKGKLPMISKAEALQQAQLWILRGGNNAPDSLNFIASRGAALEDSPTPKFVPHKNSQASFSHPYYWAPFILVGNWH